jgi:hypothetical protein
MPLPAHFLRRPPLDLSPATRAAFDGLYREAVLPGDGRTLDYSLAAPKWQFLSWLCDTQEILLHGSGAAGIREFEPRQSNDIEEFGNRAAVYAASDALWAMYFAIVDRDRYVRSLVNACFRVVEPDGARSEPYYFFSVNADALPHAPWRAGAIYILPRAGFEQQARRADGDIELEIAQWASLTPVRPLAQMAVSPEDFPFLAQIRGHDMATIGERAARDPHGFPWLDE